MSEGGLLEGNENTSLNKSGIADVGVSDVVLSLLILMFALHTACSVLWSPLDSKLFLSTR